jgi:co-chaperonin GroES (HSP10)
MSINITPLHDRVLVRRLEEKETAKERAGSLSPIRLKKNRKRAK